ncbi:hypothetical protein [Modestobacter versicolor]|uniref:Uncharacterized protein n=1 Tax=Modestobacter versicolor TaxID=429133 RepID=A0A323V5B1_9ACTN|nr:hypothetical protein [Modestobacter versicolor]MBB3676077.1 hypothetical protein [Modestobacter versicolor]PZA19942.1 hypothetical protein DMO24_18030 [Modestobacter versicolor]
MSNPELPDTAMATGNDEGSPGERSTGPLAEDERTLLEELDKPAEGTAQPAVEDSPEVATAVDDDAPLPGSGGGNDDGLDAEFTDR